ncbi:MAG TPA: ATP-binding protein [Gemmataceae bacterium]|nr:ATP-binding protein [Gemmataceae bacterium]
MPGRAYQLRIIAPTALTSLLLLAICAIAGIYLYLQQTGTAEELRENIGSRQAASNLEETLQDLAAYHRKGDEHVEPLHEKIVQRLAEIESYADKPEEKHLAAQLKEGYAHYLSVWRSDSESAGRATAARAVLEREVLPLCQELRKFNARQIDTSEQLHRQTLRWMAWGLAGVSAAGALAGLVLGYGVSRGLRRSIHQLRVRVQDAADKLGRDLPAVEMTGESLEDLDEHLQGVVRQVEQVVQTLQQREREVLRAEQLAAVGRLAAGVAHEIRNPLTSIKMLIQTAREGEAPPEPHNRLGGSLALPREDVQIIEQEVRRIERSLRSFLDFARPPKLRRIAMDLRTLPEQVMNLVRGRAAKQGVEVRLDEPSAPVVLEVDADQLRQVLLNLLLNALDAMPGGGTVTIRMRGVDRGWVELSVADSGPGIAADILPRLFTPFVSDKETGMGLGLSVSRRIAEDHGGTLTAQDRPGGGACFVIRLPAK